LLIEEERLAALAGAVQLLGLGRYQVQLAIEEKRGHLSALE